MGLHGPHFNDERRTSRTTHHIKLPVALNCTKHRKSRGDDQLPQNCKADLATRAHQSEVSPTSAMAESLRLEKAKAFTFNQGIYDQIAAQMEKPTSFKLKLKQGRGRGRKHSLTPVELTNWEEAHKALVGLLGIEIIRDRAQWKLWLSQAS